GLWEVAPGGGEPRRLVSPDTSKGEMSFVSPAFLPDASAMVFVIQRGTIQSGELAALRLSDRHLVRLGIRGASPFVTPTGFLVFGRLNGTIAAVRFDATALQTV